MKMEQEVEMSSLRESGNHQIPTPKEPKELW
jgi:hypothetical protein